MADKRTKPEASAEAAKEAAQQMSQAPRPRKRVAPTIDLTAIEEPSAPAESTSALEQSTAEHDTGPAAADTTDGSRNRLGAQINWSALAAGAAGAAIMTLLLFGLWLTGVVTLLNSASIVTRTVDTKPIDALNDRIGIIEDRIAKLSVGDKVVSEHITAADKAMKALGLALAALNRRSDDIAANATVARERAEAAEKLVTELRGSVQDAAKNTSAGISSAEFDALQMRIAGIEQSAKIAAMSAIIDMPARLALSAASLRDAAVRGEPFAAELAQVKSLGADENALALLEPFAASGVPAPAALAQELRSLLPAMLKLSGMQAPKGGFLERLQANAGKLVRIRPVDALPGEDTSSVLARIEFATAHNDISGALGDLVKLPDVVRAPAQAWIKKANDRKAALSAIYTFAIDSVRALGKQ